MLQMLQFALPEYIVGLHTRCHLILGLVLAAGLSADDVELSVQHFLQLPDFQITSIKQLGYANTHSSAVLLLLLADDGLLQPPLGFKQLVADTVHRCSGGHYHLHDVNVVCLHAALVEFLSCSFAEDVSPAFSLAIVPIKLAGELHHISIKP
jgi:hypothetical protein